MDKRNVDETVLEAYTDATVALFMEHYSAMLTQSTAAKLRDLCPEETPVPEDLDRRCVKLIRKVCIKERMAALARSAGKALRYAALFAVVLLSLSSFLFMTVEAIRVPIINYYIAQTGTNWVIGNPESDGTEATPGTFNFSDPLGEILSEEYDLSFVKGVSLDHYMAAYTSRDGSKIIMESRTLTSVTTMDAEDANTSKQCEIMGYEAVLINKEDYISLIWIDKQNDYLFALTSNGMRESEIVELAGLLIEIMM